MSQPIDRLLSVSLLLGLAMVPGTAIAQQPGFFPPFAIDESCSNDDRYALLEVHLNVDRTMNDAIIAIETERGSKEYTTSFGAYDKTRHSLVRKRMNLIREGTYKAQIQVRCETPGETPTCNADPNLSGLAWATKQRGENAGKFIVNLCPVFFNATEEKIRQVSAWDSLSTVQGDVFLHELTHFGWSNSNISVKGAADEEYDMEGVEYLAAEDPDLAVANADSYRIFMMKLAVRNRTIYR